MPIVKVGRINISYLREGSGAPPIILIAGLSMGKEFWVPVVEHLKQHYDCIMFDNRGVGESSRPRSGYTPYDMMEDTVGLLDKLSIPQAHVVGCSMGGRIAQLMALRKPERVAGLVLMGSTVTRDPRSFHVQKTRSFLQRRLSRYEYSLVVASWFFGPKALAQPGFAEEWAKKEAKKLHPQSLHAFNQILAGGAKLNLREELKNIRKPTLVMVGEDDILTPPYQSRIIAENIPGAELLILPEVGHFCVLEDPRGSADPIAGFLKRVDAR
jgi:pimeloyl-ACP methyl ester carboxylesterase